METKQLTDVKYLIVHCSATPPGMDVGVKEIDRWHRQRGFFKIGYHFVIRRNGTIEHGRSITEIGAHAVPWNSQSVGICVVGGVAEDGQTPEANFAPAQMESLRSLLNQLRDEYFPKAEVIGHRDVPGVHKACPSFDVKTWRATGVIKP